LPRLPNLLHHGALHRLPDLTDPTYILSLHCISLHTALRHPASAVVRVKRQLAERSKVQPRPPAPHPYVPGAGPSWGVDRAVPARLHEHGKRVAADAGARLRGGRHHAVRRAPQQPARVDLRLGGRAGDDEACRRLWAAGAHPVHPPFAKARPLACIASPTWKAMWSGGMDTCAVRPPLSRM
jgi:hypothetical protein